MALKRLPFISQLFNGSVGRNCSSSCLLQGAHRPKGFVDKTRVSLHYHMNLSPFTKDFRGGDLLRVICIFGDSAQSRATLEFQKQSEFDCLPARSGRKCSWSIVSTFSLCGPCVTPSYLFNQRGKTELFYM